MATKKAAAQEPSNEGFVFNPEGAAGLTGGEGLARGKSFPFIQWHYGNADLEEAGTKSMTYMGGFFVPQERSPADLSGYGWNVTEWRRGSKKTPGFWRTELFVSILAARRRWEAYNEKTRETLYFPEDQYQSARATELRVSGRIQILCVLKDAMELGPFFITAKGSASQALDNGIKGKDIDGVLSATDTYLISQANKLSPGQTWPFYAFWVPILTNRDANGKPIFTTVGRAPNQTTLILPIVGGLQRTPPSTSEEAVKYLSKFYVGPEVAKEMKALAEDAQEWAHQWDNFEEVVREAAPAPAVKMGASTNLMAPVGDEDDDEPEHDLLKGIV